jgi:PAS domain-containing protein
MPQRYGEQMKKGFNHFIKSGQGALIGNVIEMEALHKSGHEFSISILVTSFKLNNEWNAAATIRDITEQKRADELALANTELAFQKKLDVYRSEMESVAHDLTRLIDTANAPIFGIDSKGLVNEWNQASEKITGFKKDEVLGKLLLNPHYQKIAVLK